MINLLKRQQTPVELQQEEAVREAADAVYAEQAYNDTQRILSDSELIRSGAEMIYSPNLKRSRLHVPEGIIADIAGRHEKTAKASRNGEVILRLVEPQEDTNETLEKSFAELDTEIRNREALAERIQDVTTPYLSLLLGTFPFKPATNSGSTAQAGRMREKIPSISTTRKTVSNTGPISRSGDEQPQYSTYNFSTETTYISGKAGNHWQQSTVTATQLFPTQGSMKIVRKSLNHIAEKEKLQLEVTSDMGAIGSVTFREGEAKWAASHRSLRGLLGEWPKNVPCRGRDDTHHRDTDVRFDLTATNPTYSSGGYIYTFDPARNEFVMPESYLQEVTTYDHIIPDKTPLRMSVNDYLAALKATLDFIPAESVTI